MQEIQKSYRDFFFYSQSIDGGSRFFYQKRQNQYNIVKLKNLKKLKNIYISHQKKKKKELIVVSELKKQSLRVIDR